MGIMEDFYMQNPVAVIDQNQWDERTSLVIYAFRTHSLYAPLVEWSALTSTNAQNNWETELIPGDTEAEEIPLTAMYTTSTQPLDSRMRKFTVARYGDKVILNKYSNLFQQWNLGGSYDWKPLLRGVLGQNIIRKHEVLSRNAFMRGPQSFWTYAGGATSFGTIANDDKFDLKIINEWGLRLGNTGNPLVPGDVASAKMAIIPPGVKYDLMTALPAASANEAALWRDAQIYGAVPGTLFNYEVGSIKGVRFQEAPSDMFGQNPAVLYNCGVIGFQYAVTAPINSGAGSPDPDIAANAVDGVWSVGQKNVQHYIQLESFGSTDFAVNDWVTIHVRRTAAYGVTGGVDPLDTTAIVRRVVAVDTANYRLAFDRPIMKDFIIPFAGQLSVTGNAAGTFYAFVTKARHIGMVLVLGSRGGVMGKTYKGLEFYEPEPIDEFKSVWRFTWDEILGWNIANPHTYELHFCAVSLPKPGGIITP